MTRMDPARVRWLVSAVVVLLAAVIVVPFGVSALSGGTADEPAGRGSPETPAAAVAAPPVPTGWRTHSWRGIEFAVPADWTAGTLDDWCADGGELSQPVVQRPGGASYDILCHPMFGYGVMLGEPAPEMSEVPDGAAVVSEPVGEAWFTVIGPDRALAQRIRGTAYVTGEVDSSGCAVRADVPALGGIRQPGVPVADLSTPAGDARVCRYSIGPGDGPNIESSRRLTGAAADALVQALQDAPYGTGPDAGPETCGSWPEDQAVLLAVASAEVWVHYSGCRGHGIDDGHRARELTGEVMGRALDDTWSGGLTGAVPYAGPVDR